MNIYLHVNARLGCTDVTGYTYTYVVDEEEKVNVGIHKINIATNMSVCKVNVYEEDWSFRIRLIKRHNKRLRPRLHSSLML